ncbi:uncharacterized protein LOC130644878 [Hydractinia symbiolongicarpus]|uniref:uncharacterized protein LOC130644878 n=1 Tax=Hydractinia symbiolongicarpus TaxID=13093 RepID=UPI00254B599F|nr:uncharacterized protein LOC130644878 [Hydractinia symbiolongicarpus]
MFENLYNISLRTSMASLRTLLCGVCVVLYTAIVVLHCIGVYLLWKLRSVRLNQYIFLINLSTVEIFAAINHSTYVMLSDFVVTENGLIYKVFDACRLAQVSGIAITWIARVYHAGFIYKVQHKRIYKRILSDVLYHLFFWFRC